LKYARLCGKVLRRDHGKEVSHLGSAFNSTKGFVFVAEKCTKLMEITLNEKKIFQELVCVKKKPFLVAFWAQMLM